MKTSAINSNNSVNFKSNLTPKIIKTFQKTDVRAIEDAFDGSYGIDLKCRSNKFFAFCFARTLDIFADISERFNLPFLARPPQIRVFSKNDTINKRFFSGDFCIQDSGYVLKKSSPFELRSIFVQNMGANRINKKIDNSYKAQGQSSSHFLSDIIHEWIHNIHFDLIYKKYGYDGESLFGKKLYPAQRPTGKRVMARMNKYNPDRQKKRQIYETLGSYSANSKSKMEIFAEGLTQAITGALDENLMITKNPLDGIVRFPGFLKKLIEDQLG